MGAHLHVIDGGLSRQPRDAALKGACDPSTPNKADRLLRERTTWNEVLTIRRQLEKDPDNPHLLGAHDRAWKLFADVFMEAS